MSCSINFSGNLLYGGLPPLKFMISLVITDKRQFPGSIIQPRNSAISSMTSLESIDLSRNFLSGEVPEVWKNLTNLRQLDLSNNQIDDLNFKNLSAIYNAVNGSCDVSGNVLEKICLGLAPGYSLCQASCLYYWCSDTICQNLQEPNEILAYIRVMTSSCRHYHTYMSTILT